MRRIRSCRTVYNADQHIPRYRAISICRTSFTVRAGITSRFSSAHNRGARRKSIPCLTLFERLFCGSNSNSIRYTYYTELQGTVNALFPGHHAEWYGTFLSDCRGANELYLSQLVHPHAASKPRSSCCTVRKSACAARAGMVMRNVPSGRSWWVAGCCATYANNCVPESWVEG